MTDDLTELPSLLETEPAESAASSGEIPETVPVPFSGPYAPRYGQQAEPGTEHEHLLAGHHPAGGHEGLGLHVSN
jgi:hypothetical protein